MQQDNTLQPAGSYDALYRSFKWNMPKRFNMAQACCSDWAKRDPSRIALHHIHADGRVEDFSFSRLNNDSNKLANSMVALGLLKSDRVGVLLPQGSQTLVSHLAIYKSGAIAVPLALLFGEDALLYRLQNASVGCLITNAQGFEKLQRLRDHLPDLKTIILVDAPETEILPDNTHSFNGLLQRGKEQFTCADTRPDDPALMIYTSGTTGAPKGALHGHRVLLGHLPGMQMSHDFLPQQGDRIWTPADWAWAGGLLNVLLPSLMLGVPVVSCSRQKFDPEWAFTLMQSLNVANAFIPPTALKMLRAISNPAEKFKLQLRNIASAGEALGADTYKWGQDALGLNINDAYGQTECNLVLGSSAALGMNRPGSIGRAVPGHNVAILGPDGDVVPHGTQGEIAIHAPDPVMMLGYWQMPEETAAKFTGPDKNWFTTGDQAIMDENGFVSFIGRDDDIITSSGYRIGPTEVEDCLLSHPAVSLAAVVGKPDKLRTEIVKAYVVLTEGEQPNEDLYAHIQTYVRTRLSAHAYPREISIRTSLPLTTSGKIIRRALRDEAIREAACE